MPNVWESWSSRQFIKGLITGTFHSVHACPVIKHPVVASWLSLQPNSWAGRVTLSLATTWQYVRASVTVQKTKHFKHLAPKTLLPHCLQYICIATGQHAIHILPFDFDATVLATAQLCSLLCSVHWVQYSTMFFSFKICITPSWNSTRFCVSR